MRASKTNIILTLLCMAGFFAAGAPANGEDRRPHTQVSLLPEQDAVVPGRPFWIAIKMAMDPGWHTYWKNPGDSGGPTKTNWKLPPGFSAGPTHWPFPELIKEPPLASYGYTGEVYLLYQIDPPAKITSEDVKLLAHVEWLECAEVCIPRQTDVSIALPVQAQPSALAPDKAALFSKIRQSLPMVQSEWSFKAFEKDASYRINATPPSWQKESVGDVLFFADQPATIEHAAPQRLKRSGQGFVLEVQKSELSTAPVSTLSGILVASRGWRGTGSERAVQIDLPISPALDNETPVSMSLGLALVFSLLGGLILNIMPCVLPVLSIKIMGLINQTGSSRKSLLQHGLFYTAGILVCFWILAGIIIGLRFTGEQTGWGFQLQSPVFVFLLSALFFTLAFNLFGVFEIGTSLTRFSPISSGPSGKMSAFVSGLLATIVATPCTAPFMGSALGFSLTQPPSVTLAIFTFLGLGMATPFLLLPVYPGILKVIPRPGEWMVSLKQVMGFLFLATVVWLLWVFGQQTSADSLVRLLGSLLFIGVGLWIFGRWNLPVKSPRTRLTAIVAGTLFLAAGLIAGIKIALAAKRTMPSSASITSQTLEWSPYTADKTQELRKSGRAILIDFTAAWCLTCQVNEKVAFSSEDVIRKLKEKNVALLKADWTTGDPAITAALRSFGRNGVPLYVLYGTDPNATPTLLPEILTPSTILRELEKLP